MKDQSLFYRAVSGIFETVRFAVIDDYLYEQSLLQRFVQNPVADSKVHNLRLLSIEIDLLARLEMHEKTVDKCLQLRTMYDMDLDSTSLVEMYGEDHCCHCIAQSAVWNLHLDRQEESLEICDLVIHEMIPKFGDGDKVFLLLYPVLLTLKATRCYQQAWGVLESKVCERKDISCPAEEQQAQEALATLLKFKANPDDNESLHAGLRWAMNTNNNSHFGSAFEVATALSGQSIGSVCAEICLELSQHPRIPLDLRASLLQRGIRFSKESGLQLQKRKKGLSHAILVNWTIYDRLEEALHAIV